MNKNHIRVESFDAPDGKRIVIRVTDKDGRSFSFDQLEFDALRLAEAIIKTIGKIHGTLENYESEETK